MSVDSNLADSPKTDDFRVVGSASEKFKQGRNGSIATSFDIDSRNFVDFYCRGRFKNFYIKNTGGIHYRQSVAGSSELLARDVDEDFQGFSGF